MSQSREVEYQAALQWLASGDCGISSECLLYTALGNKPEHGWPPSDPSDLGRCLRLLKLLPWVRQLAWPKLVTNKQWKPILENWDRLAESMENEVGIDWSKGQSAPKTYALMKEIEL